jgi:hypothetical protein
MSNVVPILWFQLCSSNRFPKVPKLLPRAIPVSRFLPSSCEQAEIENDFQKKCRKSAKFAALTAFSARLG